MLNIYKIASQKILQKQKDLYEVYLYLVGYTDCIQLKHISFDATRFDYKFAVHSI